MKTGTLSIHTENIFPIIKKFLYTNQEVFLRELVSNAVDASQKLKTLSDLGEFKGELGDLRITVSVDPENRTLTVSDSGVGMTADEVERYINQIAFSSAEEFLDKYKNAEAQIIGHFGLGFYSAFMVADRVELITRSHQPEAKAVRWTCEGTTSFEMEETEKETRGTDIILHLSEDSTDYARPWRISEILNKYCKFLPVEVAFEDQVVNDTNPLWKRTPTELSDEDYKNFYKQLYPFSEPPLFWIHLNVDYPFTLTGVLYFPKVKAEMEQKNKIQLYANQVFITDAVDDIVPDFLSLLHGVIDSPDIPLNVSRSALQTDGNVRKISSHITKKVADKLNGLFYDNREDFEHKWDYIGLFVKYGMMRDSTFNEKARKFCLLRNAERKLYTLDEYLTFARPNQTDKDGKVVVLYSTDSVAQHSYIESAKKRGYDVLLLDNGLIDVHFINFLELQLEGAQVVRVDADVIDKLIDKGVARVTAVNDIEEQALKTLYADVVGKAHIRVDCQPSEADDLPVTITRPEHQRRMADMTRTGILGSSEIPDLFNVVVNTNHPLAKKLLLMPDGEMKKEVAQHAYELALLSQNMLSGNDMTRFIERNVKLMAHLQ